MTDGLRLALFLHHGTELLGLPEVVAALDRGDDLGLVSHGTTFELEAGGEEHLGAKISFGPLRRLAEQLPGAADAVEAGTRGVVRSGVTDVPSGTYLVFEPAGDQVTVSLVASEDDWAMAFPDDERPGRVEALAAALDAQRDDLVRAAEANGFTPAVLPRADVVEAMRRDAGLGLAVADRFDWPAWG